jgi:hypothetical protein
MLTEIAIQTLGGGWARESNRSVFGICARAVRLVRAEETERLAVGCMDGSLHVLEVGELDHAPSSPFPSVAVPVLAQWALSMEGRSENPPGWPGPLVLNIWVMTVGG